MPNDFDSPWKEALDKYFEPFLSLLFPQVPMLIDWSRGHEPLDKEFQQIVHNSEIGRRYVDKLVKVWTKQNIECWVLIHIEVQTTRDGDFPLRMYVYNYRVFDRFRKPVASLAVLADDDKNWRANQYYANQFGCESILRFPTVKLLDFVSKESALEASDNPFAVLVLAHLKAMETKDDLANRQIWKIRLVRGLYERGFNGKDVRELFRLIDWILELPPPMEDSFWNELAQLQQEKKMPFITTPERVGRRAGLREGIESMLRVRFPKDGASLMLEIQRIHEEEKLREILKALETATHPDEVRRLWLPD